MTQWPKTADQLKAEGYEFLAWGQCRSCGERIVWAATPAGRRMPLDEVCDGLSEPAWDPHFASCPDAKQWSRRERGRLSHGRQDARRPA